jgi:glycosyltransferase involved in cell wall biosynthesis
MYCGACARDAAMVRGLIARGHDVQVIPLYTPLRLDGGGPLPETRIFLGGINAYLQQIAPLFRRTPVFVDRIFDSPALLRWASRFAVSVNPKDLGPMTVSVLQGTEGRQSKELRRLLAYLAGAPRPDVVSLTNSLLSGIAPEVKRTLGVPIACALQGEDAFVMAMAEPWRAQAQQLMRRNAQAIDLFIAPGEACAAAMAEFLDAPQEKMQVIRAGIEADAFRRAAPRPRSPFVIGCLSSITPLKGQDVLVEAFCLLAGEQRRDVILRIAGKVLNPGYWKKVRGRVESAGLAARFEYCGEVDFAGKLDFLHRCSVFSMPGRIAESRGVAVIEAMAAGAPVVAPNTGVFPEMMERTGGGLLFPPEDAKELASALARLMDDPEEADRMGRAGAEGIARHYAAARMAAEMEDACARLKAEAANERS